MQVRRSRESEKTRSKGGEWVEDMTEESPRKARRGGGAMLET
jgi:hypothetical protein